MQPSELDRELHQLASSMYEDFSDVADYIWKAPNLIESERRIELEKLDEYFPLTGDVEKDKNAKKFRQIRWDHERRKLQGVFPYLIANGNLFTCMSAFETYCLMLCRSIERWSKKPLSEYKGSGISRFFKFLSKVPIDLNQLAFRSEVRAAIVIRNCLFHASGMLEWSKDQVELRKIVESRAYFDEQWRRNNTDSKSTDVQIVRTTFGDRLQITNDYAHIVPSYLRFHFIDMCKKVQLVFSGRCTIELPTSPYYRNPPQSK